MPITLKVYFGSGNAVEVTADKKEDVAEMIDRTAKKFFRVHGLSNESF